MTDSAARRSQDFRAHEFSPAPASHYAVYGTNFSNITESDRRRMIERREAMSDAKPVKRAMDIAGAAAGIVLFGPLMLVIAALIKREGGSAIFAHERIGRGGGKFRCLKFRTMVPDAAERLAALLASDPDAREEWERDHKLRNDPRITPLGAFLRKTSLDELPQFFNVLNGEMSLVGPRPITAEEVAKYGDGFAYYKRCRPGVTGIWQVSGRNDISYAARVALDIQYALNQSIFFDCVIMLRTFSVIASGSGAR